MARPTKPEPWIALRSSALESKAKRVVEDEHFYIGKVLTERQVADLDRIRGLIAIGGDLTPYYRRSNMSDGLLARQQILHLHLGGPGSDAILYLIQYPGHVLFLAVDGHVHLDDIPPGKRFRIQGRKNFERCIETEDAAHRRNIAAALEALLRPPKPK